MLHQDMHADRHGLGMRPSVSIPQSETAEFSDPSFLRSIRLIAPQKITCPTPLNNTDTLPGKTPG
jgi:hypothetical protein